MRTGLLLSLYMMLSTVRAQPIVSLPMSIQEKLIFIPIRVNGSQTLNFMFDSGAGITVLNSSLAPDLSLKITGSGTIGTSGRKLTSQTATGNTLTLDNMDLEDITLEILSLDHLSSYLNVSVDGIIGYDLFSKAVLHLDYDKQLLHIYDTLDIDTTEWSCIEMQEIDNRKLAVPLSLSTNEQAWIQLLFTLDTGSPEYIHLFPQTMQHYDLALKARRKPVYGFSADSTITVNQRGQLKRIRLGDHSWKKIDAILPVDSISIAAFADNDSSGFLGQGLLLNFNMIYDFRGGKCYLNQRE